LESERNQYLAALYELTRKPFHLSPEEIAELDQKGISLEEIIAELEKQPEK